MSPPNGRVTILNVDDTPALRYEKTHILRVAGYEVVEAETGSAALRMARELLPELVLCDVQLPDISGIELCRQLKSDPTTRRIPIIQLSASFVGGQDQKDELRGGADVYLTEPLEPRVLETVVQVLLQLRRTEDALRETESRWQRLVDSNVAGVAVVEDGRIVEANEMFQSLLGYTEQEVRDGHLSLADITPEDQRALTERAASEVLTHGSCAPCEKDYVRKDGNRISAFVGAALIDRRRRRWMALVIDISEQKRVQAEKEQAFRREQLARSQAEEATRLKDEFLANLSHELRTPMNIIIGWAHLLRNGVLSEEQKIRAAEAIERAARNQAQLIEDLLDVSRIVTGKFRLQMRDVKVGLILKSTVDNLRPLAATKQIRVTLSQEAPLAMVMGDPDRLQQVFWNLLTNSMKFTPAGGRVDVRMHLVEDQVRVAVADTGIGIASDFLPHVFDRFRQGDSPGLRQHAGMGLGLAIVRHVIELHGGTVCAESDGQNAGSTFTVALPLLAADAAAAPQARPEGDSSAKSAALAKQWRVLLIDDDADAREVTAAGLEKAGFELRAVSTAAEALRLLDHWLPDVIVSDIGMQEMNGYEFMRMLRARPPERGGRVAALALTGFARVEDAAQARSSGFQGHISKPITPEELATAVAGLQQTIGPRPT